MQVQYHHLDHATRVGMIDELRLDRFRGVVYGTKRLTQAEHEAFDELLHTAFSSGDAHRAEARLFQTAFHHYYVRAIARRALNRGDARVAVFRDGDPIGTLVDPADLLNSDVPMGTTVRLMRRGPEPGEWVYRILAFWRTIFGVKRR